MPRGEPRSVPDPAGEKVDAMLRQERLKTERAEAARFPAFSPFASMDAVRNTPRDNKTITIGDRMYRAVDTGRSIKLVPYDPLYTPAERAAQKDGVVRALFMAGHPFGTLAYGAASLAGAPQKTRDAALVAGGLADEAAGARAYRGRLKAKVHLLIVVASDLAEMPQISRPHTLAGPWLRGCSAQEASQTGGSCHPVGVAMALDTTRLGAISPQLDMEGQEVT